MTKKHHWMKWTAIAAALVLVLTSGIIISRVIAGNNRSAIVALDVNPSIELEVNRKEKVTEIRALNEEAVTVIGDMDFENVDLDVTINALIGSMLQHGYLSTEQNSILISVDTKNAKRAASLKEELSDKVSAILSNSQIEASIITQTFSKNENADTNNENQISSARAALIEKILVAGIADANGVPYTYDQLALLKVHDLKLILESKNIIEKVDGIQSSGTANDGKLIGNERALSIALDKAGATENEISGLEIEIDVSKKTQTIFYEIEFRFNGFEYEYELIASTGEIVKEEMEAGGKRPEGETSNSSPVGDEYISIQNILGYVSRHAGIAAEDMRDMDHEFKIKDGKAVYEVEFEVNKRDYDYIVDALTGDILYATVPAVNNSTATAAEELALADANVNRSNAKALETHIEYRNGEINAYLIEFEVRGDLEYEYRVNAEATEILNRKIDD